MANPASSVLETYTLATDQSVAGGATFRLDNLLVANNTASPVLILLRNAADTATIIAIIVDSFETAMPQIQGMMDQGCLIKASSGDVYVTLARSQAGA